MRSSTMIKTTALLTAALLIGLPTLGQAQTGAGTATTNQPGASENAPGQRKASSPSAKTKAPGQQAKKTRKPAKTFAPGQQAKEPATGTGAPSGTPSRR